MRFGILPLFVACGSGSEGDRGPNAQDEDTGPVDDTGTVDVEDAVFEVAATLALDDLGALQPSASGLDGVVLVDGVMACRALTALVTRAEPSSSPVEEILAWWEVDVVWNDGCDTVTDLPRTLGLGIGVLGAELEAQLGRAQLEERADALNGAYLALPDGPVWYWGAAGREEQYAGGVTAATEAPLAEGLWSVTPLVDLPLGVLVR